jgi:hypothetical protein
MNVSGVDFTCVPTQEAFFHDPDGDALMLHHRYPVRSAAISSNTLM